MTIEVQCYGQAGHLWINSDFSTTFLRFWGARRRWLWRPLLPATITIIAALSLFQRVIDCESFYQVGQNMGDQEAHNSDSCRIPMRQVRQSDQSLLIRAVALLPYGLELLP
ncbi:MAG: hypothetical protein BWY85_02096 [Firmicutes bacterium ADurb.Bin506]|nr:MAG: hypothetical protein BWY85_02096 [Firmicutes bacterium ADurb.Bin506]